MADVALVHGLSGATLWWRRNTGARARDTFVMFDQADAFNEAVLCFLHA